MNFVSEREDRRLLVVGCASLALTMLVVLAFAARARAAEAIYWDNYGAGSVGVANLDGSGGGMLNTTGDEISKPEGMAYDSVTNRLFVANGGGSAKGQITAIDLGGGGASAFTAPGAPIEGPEGVAVDPATRTVYWLNVSGAGSIAWAKLDGSAGGVLNTTGATVNSPCCRLAIDPVGGRVYWVNTGPNPNTISYANLNNSGGGNLSVVGSTVEPGEEGLAVDSAAGRLYFLGGNNEIGYANLNGSGGGDVSTGSAVINTPWGLAFDPALGRLYWANESNGAGVRSNALGFVGLTGVGGSINIATAPVDNPQDPLIIRSPTGAGIPAVTRSATAPAALSCSTGSWGPDYPGSFVYQAPRGFAYQWTDNGAAIGGATTSTFAATAAGSYACTVTATNQLGSASQASAATSVTAAKLKLTVKTKKVSAKAGKLAIFRVQLLNQGDLQSHAARLCVKASRKAKGALKAKCASLGTLAGLGKKNVKLKVKVGRSAAGTYRLKIVTKGVSAKAGKATLKVIG